MRLQQHSPHTGGFEKLLVKDIEHVVIGQSGNVTVKTKDGVEKYVELNHNYNLYVIVGDKK